MCITCNCRYVDKEVKPDYLTVHTMVWCSSTFFHLNTQKCVPKMRRYWKVYKDKLG